MRDHSVGSARIEPTEDTTVRVHVEHADGESYNLFLEPGNAVAVVEDGPVVVEAAALTERERRESDEEA